MLGATVCINSSSFVFIQWFLIWPRYKPYVSKSSARIKALYI